MGAEGRGRANGLSGLLDPWENEAVSGLGCCRGGDWAMGEKGNELGEGEDNSCREQLIESLGRGTGNETAFAFLDFLSLLLCW